MKISLQLAEQRFDLLYSKSLFTEMKKVSNYKSDPLTSKMWILPNGKPVSLDTWHYRWVLANKTLMAKFGLDVSKLPDDESVVRIAALKKGLFRVNYEHTNGTITFEGLKSKKNKYIKDAIFVIIMDNLKSIDRVKLNLFDDGVNKLLVVDEVPIFSYREDEDKLAALDDILK
jgi:hypothetical protein